MAYAILNNNQLYRVAIDDAAKTNLNINEPDYTIIDITDEELLEDKDYGGNEPKLAPKNIADAVLYATTQPDSVNVNELLIKPTGKS